MRMTVTFAYVLIGWCASANAGELGFGGSLGLPAVLGVKAAWFPGTADQPFGVQAEVGANPVTASTSLLVVRLEGRYALAKEGIRAIPFLGLSLKSGDVSRNGTSDTPLYVSGGLGGEICALPGGGVTGELGLQWKFSGAATTAVFGVIANIALMIWLGV